MTGTHRRDDLPEGAVGAVDPHRPVVDGRDRSPKELRADAEQLRVELARTAERVDAPARSDGPRAGRDGRGRSVPLVPIAVGAALLAVFVRSRRRNRSTGRTS